MISARPIWFVMIEKQIYGTGKVGCDAIYNLLPIHISKPNAFRASDVKIGESDYLVCDAFVFQWTKIVFVIKPVFIQNMIFIRIGIGQ